MKARGLLHDAQAFDGRTHMADERDRDGAKNQIKGMGNEFKGKARNVVGGLTGNSSEQIKGKAQELKGKAQRKIGEAQSDSDIDD